MRGVWFFMCFAAATLLEELEQRVLRGFIRYRGVPR
jgi:hypothetical protein